MEAKTTEGLARLKGKEAEDFTSGDLEGATVALLGLVQTRPQAPGLVPRLQTCFSFACLMNLSFSDVSMPFSISSLECSGRRAWVHVLGKKEENVQLLPSLELALRRV